MAHQDNNDRQTLFKKRFAPDIQIETEIDKM
jgi:hypothetical protein